MLLAASADESINLRLHAIELRRRTLNHGQSEEGRRGAGVKAGAEGGAGRGEGEAGGGAAATGDGGEVGVGVGAGAQEHEEVLAGEIGFSIGRVYTSLTGWTSLRSREAFGAAQLALLGRWLQARRYAFWSLGHCYSPEVRAREGENEAKRG
jgi:hypothetical protein